MKLLKIIIFPLVFILAAAGLNAEDPEIIFHQKDGSKKTYNIMDIGEMSFIKADISSYMTIYRNNDSLNAIFDTKYIEKINFSPDKSKLNVFFDGNQFNYDLSNIDSITVRQKEHRFVNVQINHEMRCLKDLKVSSFSDFNRKFDESGRSKLIIQENGLPQIMMVSDSDNNLLAMGIAKSTDTLVYINGITTAAAMVYQNVYMMGVPLDSLTDDVVDYILELGEVVYVGSAIDDSINLCSTSSIELSDDMKAILREAYINVYEFVTGEEYGEIQGIALEKKEKNKETILNTPLEVYPPEASGLIVTAEQDDDGETWVTVENTKKRHVNVRESDESHAIYRLGPNKPVLGNILSFVWDNVIHKNTLTFKKEDAFMPIHTVGMSTNIWDKVSYYDITDIPMRRSSIFRTCTSMWLGVTESVIITFIPIAPGSPKWIPVVTEIYSAISVIINDVPEIQEKINEGDIVGAVIIVAIEIEQSEVFWKNVFIAAGVALTDEVLGKIASMCQMLWKIAELGFLTNELWHVDEYDIFNISAPSKDIVKPKVQILLPEKRDIPSNQTVEIKAKLTDNENVKKVRLYVDYSSEPVFEYTFEGAPSTEREYSIMWNTGDLIGNHYLTVGAEDEAGNKASALKIVNISPNPNDNTKPTVEILSPLEETIERGASIPIKVHAADDNTIMHFNLYVNYSIAANADFETDISQERTHEFYLNTSKFSEGEEIIISIYALDANYNCGKVFKKYKIKGGGDYETVTIGSQVWMKKNLDVDKYRDGTPIRHCKSPEEWQDAADKKEGAWCYYNNDPELAEIYGKIYNGFAVQNPRGLSPQGYHIPSINDFNELENFLGGSDIAGGKLKTTGTIQDGNGLWQTPNDGATNESNFSAVPGGWRHKDGSFNDFSKYCYLFSSTESSSVDLWCIKLYYDSSEMWISAAGDKDDGISVRCIRDASSDEPYISSLNPNSAKIGDEITISGANFGATRGTSYVSFNGTQARDYPSWSDTEIKVKAPEGAKSGKLWVEVDDIESNKVDYEIISNTACFIAGKEYTEEDTELNIMNEGLSELPDCVGNLTNLTRISAWNNNLTSLPNSIGDLINLEEAYFNDNMLESIPESAGNLKSLQFLYLDNNELSSLPETIKNLNGSLKFMILSGNNFSESEKAKIKNWLPDVSINW